MSSYYVAELNLHAGDSDSPDFHPRPHLIPLPLGTKGLKERLAPTSLGSLGKNKEELEKESKFSAGQWWQK